MTRVAQYLYNPYERELDFVEAVVELDGGLIHIDTRSFIEWWIYMFSSFEGSAIDLLRRVLGPDSVVVDVGANIGVFTLGLAPSAKAVYSFEPHPGVRNRLHKNVLLNGLANVEISDLALGDRVGEVTLFGSTASNQGQASLASRGDDVEPIVCKQDRLDTFVSSRDIGRVDLIKVDVEGAEHLVLLGARATLERDHPILYIEVNPTYLAQLGSSPRQLGEYLHDIGYTLFENLSIERSLLRSGTRLRAVEEWPTGDGDRYWLAVPAQP